MSTSSRFATAVHVLTLLAKESGEPVKSESLAESLNTNPVVIRRILCELSRVEIVVSQKGSAGGSRLARKPDEITLWHVYKAVEPKQLFCSTRPRHSNICLESGTENALEEIFLEVNFAVERVLSRRTLADVVAKSSERPDVRHISSRRDVHAP